MCRMAHNEEISQEPVGEGVNLQPPEKEQDQVLLIKDIHTLAGQPNRDKLRISSFSGSIPPVTNEASFTHWIYEFKDTFVRQPAEVVRSWIFRSLRGPLAETIESMGQHVSLQTP